MSGIEQAIRDEIGQQLKTVQDKLHIGDLISRSELSDKFNWLVFGAPGTGKSYKLKEEAGEDGGRFKKIRRVTFYPNYTFAQFVGCYKPVSNEDKTIEYKYVSGPFIQTYVDAKKDPDGKYLLVIEELNRANAAAVFGDLFQLLDREGGISEFPVATSEDLKKYLDEQGLSETDRLSLPSNMYIWATMNSADQGVFPLDTAFKRRWEYEYIGINKNEGAILDKEFRVKNGDVWDVYNWNDVRKEINRRLLTRKVNEDKLIGPFYIKKRVFNSNARALDAIKSKVLLYVFEDAGRQYRNSGLFDGFNSGDVVTYDGVCKKFDEIGGGLFGVKPVRTEDTPPEEGKNDELKKKD